MNDLALKTLEPRELRLNTISLRGFYGKKLRKGSGGGSGDGFPQLPGDVTRWHFGGLTNEMMAAMDDPRIEDADHKGRFLSFKNFAWGGMSGVGGYVDNWNSSADWDIDSYWVNSHTDHKLQFITAGSVVQARSNNIYNAENVYKNILNVNGLTEAVNKGAVGGLRISAVDPITSKAIKSFSFKTDGIIQISFDDVLQDYFVAYLLYGNNTKDIDITIEQLPLYPGALVFDGVDDYGTCNNFPILTKEKGYTVVALRQWISMGEGISGLVSNVKNWFNDGAFVLEYNSNNATNKFVNRPVSFGNVNIEMDLPNNFTYQTSKSYKGVPITTGSFKGTNSLFVGKLNNIIGNCSNVAIWELVFLDHDATEEELTKIKDYFVKTYPWLFPDQAWTVVGKTNEDEDRATIANITGNGNDFVLSNFGFAGGSGYGLYYQYFGNEFGATNGEIEGGGWNIIDNYNISHDKRIPINSIGKCFWGNKALVNGIKLRFKLTGMTEGDVLAFGYAATYDLTYTSDGIYAIDLPPVDKSYGFSLQSSLTENLPTTPVIIELLPFEYEGYLVTDGVDDKITSSTFEMGNDWTVIGDWELINTGKNDNAGIVKFNSIVIYNYNPILINIKNGRNNLIPDQNTVNAICSDGRIYSKDWKESIYNEETESTSKNLLTIGYSGNNYTKIAFRNLAIYPTVLSKEDCIKAYNYLQTLKAK